MATDSTTTARWTDEQVQLLLDTVATAPTARAAFTDVARQLGKSPGTVQQKYYAMKRKAEGSNGRATGGARRKPARRQGASAATGRGTARSSHTGSDLKSLSNRELAGLIRAATAEMESRMSTLEVNVRRLLG